MTPTIDRTPSAHPSIRTTAQDTTGLAALEELVNRIDLNLHHFVIRDTAIEGLSEEGSEVRGYFDTKILVKVLSTHYGEGSQEIDSYYLRDSLPFAIRVVTKTYKEPIYINSIPALSDSSEVIYFMDKNHTYACLPCLTSVSLSQDSLNAIVSPLLEDLILYKSTLGMMTVDGPHQ